MVFELSQDKQAKEMSKNESNLLMEKLLEIEELTEETDPETSGEIIHTEIMLQE